MRMLIIGQQIMLDLLLDVKNVIALRQFDCMQQLQAATNSSSPRHG